MYFEPGKKYHSRFFHRRYALDALRATSGKVLDIGCGRGGITASIARGRRDLEFWACDKSEEALAAFRKDSKDLRIRLKKSDAHKLAFRKGQFEAVLMVDVLEHLGKPGKALKEAARVLKRGGAFHLVVPLEAEITTFDGIAKRLFAKNLKRKSIGHIQQFTLREIDGMIKSSGFKFLRVRYSYHFFYQFFSLVYFLYVGARGGNYLPLTSDKRSLNRLILWLTALGTLLVNFESGILAKIRGQTAHITAERI